MRRRRAVRAAGAAMMWPCGSIAARQCSGPPRFAGGRRWPRWPPTARRHSSASAPTRCSPSWSRATSRALSRSRSRSTMSATRERGAARERRGTLVRAGIVGLGGALPDRVVANAEITPAIGVDDDWIVRRTGIRERRYAEPGANLAELAAVAGRGALADAGVPGVEVDLVLVASCSQDSVMPNAAPQVAHALGAEHAGAFDIGSACTGFLAALAAARAMLISGAGQ